MPAKLVVDHDASLVVHRGRARPRPVDELAGLPGTLAMMCVVLPPRRPQSKGSVERSNGYLATSFLPLREFADLADLRAQSGAWTADTAWRRYHRRLGARVFEALAVERAELTPLPDSPPVTERRPEVRVSRDGFVRVAGVCRRTGSFRGRTRDKRSAVSPRISGGPQGSRTPDLRRAKAALSQLS